MKCDISACVRTTNASAGLFLAITTVLAFLMATFVFVIGLISARRYVVT